MSEYLQKHNQICLNISYCVFVVIQLNKGCTGFANKSLYSVFVHVSHNFTGTGVRFIYKNFLEGTIIFVVQSTFLFADSKKMIRSICECLIYFLDLFTPYLKSLHNTTASHLLQHLWFVFSLFLLAAVSFVSEIILFFLHNLCLGPLKPRQVR